MNTTHKDSRFTFLESLNAGISNTWMVI